MNSKFSIKLPFDTAYLQTRLTPLAQIDRLTIIPSPTLRFNIKGNEIIIRLKLDLKLDIQPATLDFGNVPGDSFSERIVTIQNAGNVPLSITRFETDVHNFSIKSDTLFPIAIKPKQKRTVFIQFRPSSAGVFEGLLTFFSNDLEHQPIVLRGSSISTHIEVKPKFIDFGNVKMGTSVQIPLRIWNLSSSPLEITKVAFQDTWYSLLFFRLFRFKFFRIKVLEWKFYLQAADETLREGKLHIYSGDLVVPAVSYPYEEKGKSSPGAGLSQPEAKSRLDEFNNNVLTYLREVVHSVGFNTIKELLNLINRQDVRYKADNLRLAGSINGKIQVLLQLPVPGKTLTKPNVVNIEPFDFESYRGLYNWNPDLEKFQRVGDSDIMDITFPTKGATSNDTELKIINYAEQVVTDVEEPDRKSYQPNCIQASLIVDKIERASVDFRAEYREYGFSLAAYAKLTLGPFVFTFSFDNGNPGSSFLHVSVLHDQTVIASGYLIGEFPNNTKIIENLRTFRGFIQLSNIEVNGSVDVRLGVTIDNPVENIQLSVFCEDKKIGDIVLVDELVESRKRIVPYLQYTNGSKEKLEDVLKQISAELANMG